MPNWTTGSIPFVVTVSKTCRPGSTISSGCGTGGLRNHPRRASFGGETRTSCELGPPTRSMTAPASSSEEAEK